MMKKIILIIIIFLYSGAFAFKNYTIDINLDFFKKFNDSYFEKYIFEAYENNHDLKKARWQIEQYRYEINNAFARELPNLSVSSNYLGTHFPKGDANFFIRENSYILPFNLSFEPDLLLKNKDNIVKNKELYKAKIMDATNTYISLLTDVATSYVNILLYDYLIEKQKEVIENKKQNETKNQHKYHLGIIDIIDFNDIEKELESQKSLLNILVKNRNQTLYHFATLIGLSPDCIGEIKRGTLEDFEYQGKIPTEIESRIIFQRPDVIEIEKKLKAAKLDITIAKKDFFPNFKLNGGIVFDTAGPGNFFSWNSSFAYLLAGLTQDIFKGGAKWANFKIKKAKYYELVETYRQKDLTALQEVNNALNIIKQDSESEKNFMVQVNYSKEENRLNKRKLHYGIISNIDFINSTIELLQKYQFLAISKATRLVDYFTLYKATAGHI